MQQDQAPLAGAPLRGETGICAFACTSTPELMELRRVRLEDHQRLLASSRAQRFEYAEKLVKDKDGLPDYLADLGIHVA